MNTTDAPKAIDEHPVDMAARLMGGRPAMAEKLGVSSAAIGNWKARGVPFEKCPVIERLTSSKVTRIQLRPNDWEEMWPELAPALANTAQAATAVVAVQGA